MNETNNLVLEQLRVIGKEIAELKEGQDATRIEVSVSGSRSLV